MVVPLGQAAGADSSRFVIQIDLTADGSNVVEHYNKPRAVGIEDGPGNIRHDNARDTRSKAQ
jgi:hypothetical protein